MASAVAPARTAGIIDVRCHRCSHHIGEASAPMEFVGVVKLRELRELVAPPRLTWKCKCGWMNIFVPIAPPNHG